MPKGDGEKREDEDEETCESAVPDDDGEGKERCLALFAARSRGNGAKWLPRPNPEGELALAATNCQLQPATVLLPSTVTHVNLRRWTCSGEGKEAVW